MVFQHSTDAGKNFSFLSAEFPENVCAGGQRSTTPAWSFFDPPLPATIASLRLIANAYANASGSH